MWSQRMSYWNRSRDGSNAQDSPRPSNELCKSWQFWGGLCCWHLDIQQGPTTSCILMCYTCFGFPVSFRVSLLDSPLTKTNARTVSRRFQWGCSEQKVPWAMHIAFNRIFFSRRGTSSWRHSDESDENLRGAERVSWTMDSNSSRLWKQLSWTCQGKENEGVHLQWAPEIDPSAGHAIWLFTLDLGVHTRAWRHALASLSCLALSFVSRFLQSWKDCQGRVSHMT